MKKVVSLILLTAVLMTLTCCSHGMSPAENFLLAVRKMDIASMEALMTSDSAAAAARMREYADSLAPERRSVLISLYSKLKYTVSDETETENETKTVFVNLTIPDMAALKSFAEAKMAVSGESAYEIVQSLLDDGAVSGSYMVEKTITVTLKMQNGEWLIPYSESANAELVSSLFLAEMLRFFTLN